jgi:hypothetical protein
MKRILIISALAAIGFGPVLESAFATDNVERFSITRTDDGYIRTDAVTGAISKCTETAGQLVCRMAADDRQAYDASISDLEAKIDSLETRIAALEKSVSPGSALQSPAQNEKEFETSLNQMERFFRRFMGIVKEFQTFGGDTTPAPDRT